MEQAVRIKVLLPFIPVLILPGENLPYIDAEKVVYDHHYEQQPVQVAD